jgi:hypothetical protein
MHQVSEVSKNMILRNMRFEAKFLPGDLLLSTAQQNLVEDHQIGSMST